MTVCMCWVLSDTIGSIGREFVFMMTSGLTGSSVNEFISRCNNSMTWDPNKYDNFRSGNEKVNNSVNSLGESTGGEMIGNRL